MLRFDRIDGHLERMAMKEKMLDGERLMDNQDVCQMLNISKRTLQRYRSLGVLPYRMLYQKAFYKQSDVEAFMKNHFDKTDANANDADSGDNGNTNDTYTNPEEAIN
jgi:hypothetical protein